MRVKDLIDTLKNFDQTAKVMILDGSNGGGCPRTINCGPFMREVTENDQSSTDDCDGLVGHKVVVIGFGCY